MQQQQSFVEFQFWNLRLRNLNYIYQQLLEPRVRKMAVLLEKSQSAYFDCFRVLFKKLICALAEAKDICIYLKPLKRHVDLLQETDFSESLPLYAPLLHVVCLIWSNSKYYDQTKVVVLLKQIGNLLIVEVFAFLASLSFFFLIFL